MKPPSSSDHTELLIRDFNHTIEIWINALEHYDFRRLCAKPSPGRWSFGQTYMHLIDETQYYIKQIQLCTATDEHAIEEASTEAQTMLRNNDFPNEALEGSPANADMPQPESKEQLREDLLKLKDEMNKVAAMISENPFHGKTKHPGLNYFSAREWLQFAEMHFRHHLRQKKRIDDYLKLHQPR